MSIKIKSTYTEFSTKTQPNTYFYYNFVITKYLKNAYEWFTNISEDDHEKYRKIYNEINTTKPKDTIDPYYKIYKKYLTPHSNIFKKDNTFIDLGSSPGGFLSFSRDIGMNGIGITLEPSSSNKALKIISNASYNIIYGNLLDEKFISSLQIKDKVDFINMGAVFYDKTPDGDEQQRLLLNQFYIVLNHLKPKSSIMFISDIFYSLINLIKLADIFIRHDCNIHIIPVQPSFNTTQAYILIENLTMTSHIYDQITSMVLQIYLPITNIYSHVCKQIFESKNFNISSFKEFYLINIINRTKQNKDVKLIPILKLDILNKIKFNFEYIFYDDILAKINGTIYNINNYNSVKEIRKKFLIEFNVPLDANDNIKPQYKPSIELFMNINKIIKKIHKEFIKKTFK